MTRKILKSILLGLAVLAGFVLIFGLYQYFKANQPQQLVAERIVQAPHWEVWKHISDVGNYEHVTGPGISRVDILEGSGEGMIRECADPQGNSWEEVCTIWEEGHRFKFEVNTQREDYAYPLKSLSGTWSVEELGPTTSKMVMQFDFEFTNPFLSGFFLPWALKQAREDMDYIMDNWQSMAEGR